MNRLRKISILTHYFFKPNNFITMAGKNQKQTEKTAKMTESAQAQTQEVEKKVAESPKEETLEQKAEKMKKDLNVGVVYYCNGKFFVNESEAIKEGTKGFAYYIF